MPHEPFQPTPAALNRVDEADLPPLNYEPGDLEAQPPYLWQDLGIPHDAEVLRDTYYPDGHADQQAIDVKRKAYYALVGMVDDQVGRVRAAIDRQGLAGLTLTVFTSDHGSTLFDRGFKDKHCFYDEVWRVPLIYHAPGRLESRRVEGITGWIDLTPTLARFGGVESAPFQGLDTAAALLDPGKPWPRRALAASVYHTLALATPRWTLEYDSLRARGRLFDRPADPAQRRDLWADADPRIQRERDRLLHQLLAWRAALGNHPRQRRRFTPGGPVAGAAQRAAETIDANHADRLLHQLAEVG
jgi:arylsulfatase A-like enzyme